MKALLLLAFLSSILLLTFISASCDSGQIDINSASLSELDEITGIGPAKAQAIIDTRPFVSVDDLIRVSGIGNITSDKNKNAGACMCF